MVQDPQRIDLSLEPLDEYVVLHPSDGEAETRGGLILPVSAQTSCGSGIVTAIGSDVVGIEPGDKVLYPKDAGYDVRVQGVEAKVIKRGELVARIHD